MPESLLRLIQKCQEFTSKEDRHELPSGLRGIYVLYRYLPKVGNYDVVYVGMATGQGGVRSRLYSHARSKRKGHLWTHFSAFKVWDNIRDDEVRELEGLFRHLYRKDRNANALNLQKGFKPLKKLKRRNGESW